VIQWRKSTGSATTASKGSGYNGTIALEVFAPEREYLLLSRDLVRKWWGEDAS